MQKQIISCDWGTTSFRLRLIDTQTKECISKFRSEKGNASLYKEWKSEEGSDRLQFYLKYLKITLQQLSSETNEIPILISGMASSSVGMKELPYANLPFSLDGVSAETEWINDNPVISSPILLISGVQQDDDVMRGEETQLIGIASLMDVGKQGEHVFILPGTHSKHITVKDGAMQHFQTFMTGETFEVMMKHSILAHAVEEPEEINIGDEENKYFCMGVEKALNTELLNALFSVRIKQLKKRLTPHQNYYYFSGLLIGSELKHITNGGKQHLVLCSNGILQKLYELAITQAGLINQTTIVPKEILDNAAAAGQLKIFENMMSKQN